MKKLVSKFLIICLIVTMLPLASVEVNASLKLSKPTITFADEYYGEVTLKWKKVKNASGYQVYRSLGTNSFKKIKSTTKVSNIDKSLKYTETKTPYEGKVRYKVRAYKTYKVKRYYNSKKHKWVSKKPKKKYWKGRRVKYIRRYKYSSFSATKTWTIENIKKQMKEYRDARDAADLKAAQYYTNLLIEKWYPKAQEYINNPIYYHNETRLDNETNEIATKRPDESDLDFYLRTHLQEGQGLEYRPEYLTKISGKAWDELSDVQKVIAIDKSRMIDETTMPYTLDPEYAYKVCDYSLEKTLKLFYEGKLKGCCDDNAWLTIKFFKTLGIKGEYTIVNDGRHAISTLYPKNADGKTISLRFEYGSVWGEDIERQINDIY